MSTVADQDKAGCFVLIVIFAFFGGMGVHFFTQGLHPNSKFPQFKKYTLSPFTTHFVFPTLLAQIIWGCLVRNGLAEYMTSYDDDVGSWVRSLGTGWLLIRTGLELNFSNLKSNFWAFVIVPTIAFGIVGTFIYKTFLDIGWMYAISVAFLCSAPSPSIIVPCLLNFKERKIGTNINVSLKMLNAVGINVVFSLLIFQIFAVLATNDDLLDKDKKAPKDLIIGLIKEMGSGIGIAVFLVKLLEFLKNSNTFIKMFTMVIFNAAQVTLFKVEKMGVATLLCALVIGYGTKCVWGSDVPAFYIKYIWYVYMPVLFGHAGSQLYFAVLDPNIIGLAIAASVICVLVHVITAFLILYFTDKTANNKEKLFQSVCWSAKSTIQASFCGFVTTLGKSYSNKSIIEKGSLFVTAGMMMVAIMAPIGAITVENAGPKLLKHEEEVKKPVLTIETQENDSLQVQDQEKKGTMVEMPIKSFKVAGNDRNNVVL